MAIIKDPQLEVVTDRGLDRATVIVRCDVEFSDFEVNAMNRLGLQYTLECQLLDMDMLYEDGTVPFIPQVFPSAAGTAQPRELAVFKTQASMRALHRFIFGKDPLAAELTLRNLETGDSSIRRSPDVRVDLAV
jgi:hypothetical protein